MAKVSVIRVPRLPASRGRVRHFARRAGSAVAAAARDEKHTLVAVGAAAALGYATRKGADGKSLSQKLPRIDALGVAGTYGILAWAGAKYTKNRTMRHVATGLLAVAAYKFGQGDGATVEGDDDGDDDVSGGY